MAASGYTPISLYYSTTASAVPTAGNLANGELALNIADMKLYAKNSAGTVTLLASNASTTGVDSLSFGSTGLTPSTATTGAITVAGTLNVANGGTGVTSSTGTGSVVLSNSPTLVTPALGTPSSATLTNATGLPISTGVSGLGTGVATALAVNVGSAGAPVVNGGALGTPSSGTVTNLTGTASININGTVGATTPTTGAFTTLTTSSTVTLNGGTANGVTYLNGSKVLTSGSALTFNGSTLATSNANASFLSGSSSVAGVITSGAAGSQGVIQFGSSQTTYNIQGGPDYTGLVYNVGSPSYQHIWQIAGSEQGRWTTTGLGIGLGGSSPAYKLDVTSSALTVANFTRSGAGATSLLRLTEGSGGYVAIGCGGGTSNMSFRPGGTELMLLDSAGNLGLGVTPSAWTSSIFRASQFGNYGAFVAGRSDSTNQIHVGVNTYYSNPNWVYTNTAPATRYVQAAGVHEWHNAPSGTAGTTATFTQAMTLDASGNLLVGATSVGYSAKSQFVKQGTTSANNSVTDSAVLVASSNGAAGENIGLRLKTGAGISGTTFAGQLISSGNNIFEVYTVSAAPLVFGTDATERARIDSSGNLLVGTTATAAAKLTIVSTTNPALTLPNIAEIATISATAATGTINYDLTTQSVLYYTTNASGNFTMNIRGNSGLSLNSMMSTGQSVTMAFLCTNGATAYYQTAMTIDGSSVTPKWQGGTAPTTGNASSIDSYVYTIIKTASATFTVLASQTKFA